MPLDSQHGPAPAAFRKMLDLVREAAFQTDLGGRFVYVNAGWQRLTGLTLETADQWIALLGRQERRAMRRVFTAAGADGSGDVHQAVIDGTDPEDRQRSLRVMVRRIEAGDGFPEGFVCTIVDESGRLRLQQELDVAQTRFESAADVVPVGIYRVGRDGRITYFNRRWAEWLGPLAEGAMGRHWSELAMEMPDFQRNPPFRGYSEGRPERHRIVPVPQIDGSERLLQTFNRAEYDVDGNQTGFVGVAVDVTEQVASQKALVESERAYAMLAEQSPGGVFRTDPTGDLTFVNRAYTAITGLTMEQSLGDGWLTNVHPDDMAEVAALWHTMIGTQTPSSRKLRWVHQDGKVVVTEAYAQPERSEDGQILGFIGIVVDVTERDRTQAELQRQESEFELLVENSSDAIFRVTLDGTCLFASPAVREQLGMPPEALIGRKLLDPLHPEDRDRVMGLFQQLARGETDILKAEYRTATHVAPDTYIWLEASCRLVRDENGTPKEIIANIRDMTRRNELVARLQKARQTAEDAARSRAVFLANMSHEIRTPMNGVLGFTRLLSDTRLDEEQTMLVDTIRESGRSMMVLLDDILDLSRIEAGKIELRPAPVDLRHLVREVARVAGALIAERPVNLVSEVDDEVPTCVLADRARIRQILINLLGNAAKFTSEGQIMLRVSMGDDGQVRFAVTDTGIGIAPDAQDRVFRMFEQAGYDTHRHFGGTGLGLAICINLAELMNGSLTLESEEGVGSTFTLGLPLALAEPAQAPAIAAPSRRAIGEARVLVAEDNETNRLLIRMILQRMGIDPVMVEDGRMAVDAATAAAGQGAPFDIVLMDVEMPVMDGCAATRAIRAAGLKASDLPIVALTAHAFQEDERRCIEAGMQAHLTKPISPEAIERGVMPFLREKVAPTTGAPDQSGL